MKRLLSVRLASRFAALLVVAAAFTGCNASRQSEKPVFHVTRSANAAPVQFFSASPSQIRHRRLDHTPQFHHRLRAQTPEGPMAVN